MHIAARHHRKSRSARTGATAVEFALVAPAVFLLILGLIQFAGLMMSVNVMSASAREGARLASLAQTTTKAAIETRVNDHLSMGGVDPNHVTVDIEPTVLSNLEPGDEVTITVSGAVHNMVWIGPLLPTSAELSARFTAIRE